MTLPRGQESDPDAPRRRGEERCMRVMVIVKANERIEAGELPGRKLLEEMGAFNEQLVKSGIILAGDGLHPSSKGVRVVFAMGKQRIIDGPFAETKELIAGFWLWQVKSMEEAIEWVRRMPQDGESEAIVEIRPLLEADDFGENFTPELRAKEEELRAESARRMNAG